MKIRVLTMTILNFVVYFPYNASQKIHSQTNQHLSANPSLSSSDSHTANLLSPILRIEENSSSTEDSDSYSGSTDRLSRLSRSLSERNHSETLQASLYNFLPFGHDALNNTTANQASASFAKVKRTVGNSAQAEVSKSNASSSSDATHDTSASATTISSFVPKSQITPSRMTVSGKNSISAPVSMTTYQHKSDSTAIPNFQIVSKATQRLKPFFPSTGRSKPFFAPNPTAYIQNAKNEFPATAIKNTIAISNANNFLGTGTTTHEEETGPDSVFSIYTTALAAEDNTAKSDTTDILEKDYTTMLDESDLKDNNIIIIDTTYLGRYSKIVSNEPDLPKKDISIVIEAADIKNDGKTTVNAQTPSILSTKNSNNFKSTPILNTYDKADNKSTMIGIDTDDAISSINPMHTTNYLLNDRMYEKSNSIVSNSTESKTMIDVAKNMMHVGNLIISKTNNNTSTKHYSNPNPIELIANTNNNFKITWPSKEGTIIEGRHTVQMENIMTPNNINIAEATGSKVNNSTIKYHSNIPDNVHLKIGRDNFKSVSTDEIENVTSVVKEIANMNQDNRVVEVIFIYPDTSTAESKRKLYPLNPDTAYAKTAGSKITIPPDNSDTFNLLFKYKRKPFTTDSKNLINSKGDQRTPTTITANDVRAKMYFERTINAMLKSANFQSNITPVVPITQLATVEPVYFSKDSEAGMTSASKVSISPSNKSTESVDETTSLSAHNNNADGVAGPNPEIDLPVNKWYTFPSVAESSKLMPNARNNEALISMLINDDSLTGAWMKIADPAAQNSHLTNDAIIYNKVAGDSLHIPLESTFFTADFTSPSDKHNTISSAGEGNTDITESSELMINKATIAEDRSLVSPPAKIAGILTPRKRFSSLIGKEMANEESTPHMKIESVVGEHAVFKIKDNLPPAYYFKDIESEDIGFERNDFRAVDITKSPSQFSVTPTTEVTISERELSIPGEENVDVLYDVTNATKDKMRFKLKATKAIAHGSGESAAVRQNVGAADGTTLLPPSTSSPQTGRMDYPTLPNVYYNVITDNSLPVTKENPNVAWNIIKHELSLSTMDNAELLDYRDGYQAPIAVTSSNANRQANKGKMAGTEVINIPLGISVVADDISYMDKNTKVVTDLASIAATSPIKKSALTVSEDNTLNNKPNKLGDGLTISREDPDVSRDDGILLIADPSAFMKSVAHFNQPQSTNPVKKTSLADIIIPKTYFHNKATPTALTVAVTTASQGEVDTMFYIPRNELENSFKENITLNYEADPPKEVSIMAEEEDTLQEENVRDYIYLRPIADDNVPKGNNLAAKQYSINSDAYDSIRFRGTTKGRGDQLEFENPVPSYMAEVSKPLLGKFTPKVQRKVIVRNSDIGSHHDAFSGGDIFYPIIKENVPKGYISSPERESTFPTSDFRISMKDNINPALEGTVLLTKGTFSNNYSSYTDEQSDPATGKHKIAPGNITNSHIDFIPLTSFATISSKDINKENYYHTSEISTTLSLGYENTLRDDSFILRPGSTVAKKNHLDDIDLIIIEPDKSRSEYTSNKHVFEVGNEENIPIKKPIPSAQGPNGFVSHIPSFKDEASRRLLYQIIHPELETEEKYQTIILKEENSDSDIVSSFKGYTKNSNTQHLKTMAPSLVDADENSFPGFLQSVSAGKGTLSTDDAAIILPEVSDLGNKKTKHFFVPHTETIFTMGEDRTLGAFPTDHIMITTPIKSQDHFYRKGISSNVPNTASPELGDSIASEKSGVNEDKMDLAELTPSENDINPSAQDIASQAKNISYVSKVTKDVIKANSTASLNMINATKMPPNARIISFNAPAFGSKDSNENSDTTIPKVDGVLSIKLKSLLIPNQKIHTIELRLSENDDSLFNNTSVTMLEVSEPLGEHSTIIDPNWEIIKVQSVPQPLFMLSPVPLEDPTTFLKKPINVATDTPATENEDINAKTDSMAFSPNIALQPVIHKNGEINTTSNYDVSHHVNQEVNNPSAKEIATSGTEPNIFLSRDKAVVEDKLYVSEANFPVNVREINTVRVDTFILKPDAASAEHKVPGNSKEMFYPDSTVSTTKVKTFRAQGSLYPDNDNSERSITKSYGKLYNLTLKSPLSLTDFIKISNSELDPALIGESNKKMTGDSIIPHDIIVLPDKEIISPENVIFIEDMRNTMNGKRYAASVEKDNLIQYEVIPFTKDFSAESDVTFLAGENNPINMDLMNIGLDDHTLEYVSERNTFYAGEEGKSPATKIPAFAQSKIYRGLGSHAPLSTAHVTENLLKGNPTELKTKLKYQTLISRERNPDSNMDYQFLKDYIAKFYSKSPRTMTHSLTDRNKNFSPKFSYNLTSESGSLSGSDSIIILPEGKWMEHIHAPDPESTVTEGDSRTLPGEITHLTMQSAPMTNRDQLYRKGISSTAFNVLREAKATMSPKSEHNKDKSFKAGCYHPQDVTVPSIAFNVNLDNELPFVDEDSGDKKHKDSNSYSPRRTTHTMADATALSPENSYEGSDYMQPDKKYVRSGEFPFQLATESIILNPKALTKNSILMRENPLTDSSKSVSIISEAVTEYLDLINGTDISKNQVIKIQTDLQPHSLFSIIPSTNATTLTRNSTNDDSDSSSTTEREIVDISKVKTAAHPQGTIMKILSPKQIHPPPFEIGERGTPSVEGDTAAIFSISHIRNATVLFPTLEKALPSTSEPSTLPKSSNSEKGEVSISKAGYFVLGNSNTLKDNSFIGKFNISVGPQALPSLKGILSADSTVSLEKTLKLKDNNSAPPVADTVTEDLLHNAPAGSHGLTWKSTLSPSDFTTLLSSPKYSELDPLVKMNKDATTKTNDIPFEERNTPTHKITTSPSINTSTKGMLNTIFSEKFVHRNFAERDIIPEHEVVPVTENILDITLKGENIINNDDVISAVLDDGALAYVTSENVLEPQEEKYNPIIKKTTLTDDPQIFGSHPFFSTADASEHLSQGAPTEITTKEIWQNLKSTEEHSSSDTDAIVIKSSTNNLSSKAPRSMIHPLIHTSENFHKFLDKTILERETLREYDIIITVPEDKRMEHTLIPDPEITVEKKMALDEITDPIVILSPLKNKNQSYRKVTSSTIYNTDIQDKADNTLPLRVNSIKGKTNMAEMPHSQDIIIPLAEFNVLSDSELSLINEDTEVLNNRASISFSPMNTDHAVDDTTFLPTEGSYEGGDSMLTGEDSIRSTGFLQVPEKPMLIPNALADNPQISSLVIVTNTSLTNSSIAWSEMFETMNNYTNVSNGGDVPIKNKTHLKSHSLASTKLPIGFTNFSDSSTKNEFDSRPSINRETTDIPKTETDEIHSERQRIIMKAFSPTKISQHKVYDKRKIANCSDPAAKFDLSHITNAIVFRPAMKKILPSVTQINIPSKSGKNVEEEVHIFEARNFFPKDPSILEDNSFTVKFDAIFAKPLSPSNLKGISSADSTLTFLEASRPNDQSSSPEDTTREETITNTSPGTHGLPWKSTLLPSHFTTSISSSKYSELYPVFKMEKDTTTNNNIIPVGQNTPPDKFIVSSTTITSTKDMKNTISKRFEDKVFIEKDISTEVVPFTENISEGAHDTPLAGENIPNNDNIVTTVPVDSALEYDADNYVFVLVEERNGPLIEKATVTNDSNVFESHESYSNALVSDHLSHGAPVDTNTHRKHQSLATQEENLNSDNDATVLKSYTATFKTKARRPMIYSLTDPSWNFLPKLLDETILENGLLIGGNTVIILPEDKRVEYPLVPDPELMSTMGENRMFTADSIDPAVITIAIDYQDKFNRSGVSSAFYNNVAPDVGEATISARFDSNKFKTHLADVLHSQNNIISLVAFNVIPNDDLPFISKDTEEANNRASDFSSSMNKASSTVADFIVPSTKGSYAEGDSLLPGEDNVKSRGFSSLLKTGMLITNFLLDDPDTSGLGRDNSFSESSITRPEALERAAEYGGAIKRGDVPEGQVIITQTDIRSYTLAWNISPVGSTFSDTPPDDEIDSFFSLNKNIPEKYKTETDKTYSKSQRAIMKAFSPTEESQNYVYKIRKTANLFDQKDLTAKFELNHFTKTPVIIPAMGKICPSATEPNPLSNSNHNVDEEFHISEAESLFSGDTSTVKDDSFTDDISEKMDDISSAGKITPVYVGQIIMSDDGGSEYSSDKHVFELEDKANNPFTKMSTLRYAPKTRGSHALYTTVAASDSLSKAIPSEFKAEKNKQAIIPIQEDKNFDIDTIPFKDPTANVKTKARRLTTDFLIDASEHFPSRFSDTTPVRKGTINGNDDIIILSGSSHFGNKIVEHPIFSDIKPIIDSKTFTTDTANHAIKNSYNLLRKNKPSTIYKTFTPKGTDTTHIILLKMKQL